MNIPTEEGWYWLKLDNFPLAVYCKKQRAYGGRLCAQIVGRGIVPIEEAEKHWKWEAIVPMGSSDELAQDFSDLQVSHDELFDRCVQMKKVLMLAIEFSFGFADEFHFHSGAEVNKICKAAYCGTDKDLPADLRQKLDSADSEFTDW